MKVVIKKYPCPKNKVFLGDCLEVMNTLPRNSIDMILCDPPYGTTNCKWDSVISLDKMWENILRVSKQNSAVVMTSCQPFTSVLINSNPKLFRYDLVWCKSKGVGFYNANKMPLRAHENILVFYKKLPKYFPQKTKGTPYTRNQGSVGEVYTLRKDTTSTINTTGDRHPFSWKVFKGDKLNLHPTQKPVALMEYLIKTYTEPNDLILDFAAGSGTTAVACINSGRNYILIEKNKKYFDVCENRIEIHKNTKDIKI